MADYAIENGRFLQACDALLTQHFQLSWYDRFPSEEHVRLGAQSMATQIDARHGTTAPIAINEALANAVRPGGGVRTASHATANGDVPTPVNKSNRVKYTCSGCAKFSVWGKPEIELICGTCKANFFPV